MSDRDVFTEEQVAQIIRVAARRHGSDAGRRETSGVTRAELERLAQEVGIAPHDLDAAIEQVRSGEDRGGPPWRKRTFERVVEGEFAPEAYAESLLNLPVANVAGSSTTIGNTFRTAYMAGLSSQELKVVAKDGRTRIRVETTPVVSTIFAFILLFIATMAAGASAFDKGAPAVGAIIAAIGYTLAYLMMRTSAQSGAAFARRILGDMGEALQRATPAQPAPLDQPVATEETTLETRLTQG